MNLEAIKTDVQDDLCRKILSVASLFNHEFNIDWLQELTAEKASTIFAALDAGVQKKCLSHKKNGFFYFINAAEQEKYRSLLSLEEKKKLHKQIVDLLYQELSGDPHRLQSIVPHLFFLNNDLNGCRFLVEYGNSSEKEFRYDKARQAYGKAIEDLRKLSDQGAQNLFIRAALRYSKVCVDEIGVDKTISILKEAIDLVNPEQDKNSLALLEMYLAKNEWMRSRFKNACRHFKKE
ncbi:MAG: hypothetical protein RBS82_02095, partial [Syntrophales bacterium]|nr:hypothetical protein [Syntrophales bacterium]